MKSKKRVKSASQLDSLRSKFSLSLDYIFEKNASRKFDLDTIEFELSPRTGRPRYVLGKADGQILFSFRANGSLAPTVSGAKIMLGKVPSQGLRKRPRWTLTVIDGVTEVVSKGKTVFCKHVVMCDDTLRANEDVAVLNERGELLAVGRSVLSGPTIKQFKKGVAVKVREGSNLSKDVTSPTEHGQ